jgi:hypothetical protein
MRPRPPFRSSSYYDKLKLSRDTLLVSIAFQVRTTYRFLIRVTGVDSSKEQGQLTLRIFSKECKPKDDKKTTKTKQMC